MKFTVDLTQCENHGQCALSAPELFSLDASGQLSFRAGASDQHVSGELTEAAADSVGLSIDTCPMQAIQLVD